MHLAIADLDDAGPAGVGPVMLGMYEQLLVTGLLLGQPNNYTDALQRLENKVAPGDVKRAIDFIEAHLHLPVTLADIAGALGVPANPAGAFQNSSWRLADALPARRPFGARAPALMSADDTASVTDIAMKWGFNHLGRLQSSIVLSSGNVLRNFQAQASAGRSLSPVAPRA